VTHADNLDRPAARLHGLGPRRREAITNEAGEYLACEAMGEHDRFSEPVRGIGEDSERAAPFRPKSRFSGRHHAFALSCAAVGGSAYSPVITGIAAEPGHHEHRRPNTRLPTDASG